MVVRNGINPDLRANVVIRKRFRRCPECGWRCCTCNRTLDSDFGTGDYGVNELGGSDDFR